MFYFPHIYSFTLLYLPATADILLFNISKLVIRLDHGNKQRVSQRMTFMCLLPPFFYDGRRGQVNGEINWVLKL